VRQASTASFALATLLAVLLVLPASAQGPWQGWKGPWADGIFGFRFGMDRAACREVASRSDLTARTARPGTLRYEGRLGGAPASLVLEFAGEPRRPGRESLHRILVTWDGISGGGSRAVKLFDRLEEGLRLRYGPPRLVRDASVSDISNGYGEAVRLHEGPECQARLILRSPGAGSLRLQLILISPQLHPDFPR